LLAVFTTTLAANRRHLEKALAGDDWPQVARLAHAIKGSSSILGFGQIANIAESVERQARNGAAAQTPEFLARLKALEEKLPSLT
jgi:HPt (histidine-containing phosphotransfer) domain-containing protein